MSDQNLQNTAHQKRLFRRLLLRIAAALAGGLLASYWWRPDALAALTIFPAGLWLAPGVLLLALCWPKGTTKSYRQAWMAVAISWFLFLLAFVEEPISLLRSAFVGEVPKDVRVVSLNCSGGSTEATAEAFSYQPDILLLQEAPGVDEVRELVRDKMGADVGVLVGFDTAIIVRGEIQARPLPRNLTSYFVQARVRMASGIEAEVFSVRLLTPPFRADLWNIECWNAQRQHREGQRAQMQAIARRIEAVPSSVPIIIGDDFNAPQGDAIFRLLQPRLRHSFRTSGLGWGNTITNEHPFLRIDQIWTSRQLRANSVRAYPTEYSDHRLVVCDLQNNAEPSPPPTSDGNEMKR